MCSAILAKMRVLERVNRLWSEALKDELRKENGICYLPALICSERGFSFREEAAERGELCFLLELRHSC